MIRRRRQLHQDALSRRDFMRQAACAAVGTQALISTVWDLRLVNAAVTAMPVSPPTDYKALICIFLYGGNDANNLIAPNDPTGYASYAAIRNALALSQGSLLGITGAPPDAYGRTFGLHPSFQNTGTTWQNSTTPIPATNTSKSLIDLMLASKAAVVANVGTLITPTTKTQYRNKTVPLPPQLFSHNDQQVQWQTSVPNAPATTGWAGRCADLLNDAANMDAQVSMSISVGGTNTFEVGKSVNQYAVSSGGSVEQFKVNGNTTVDRIKLLKDLFDPNMQGFNLFQQAFAGSMKRSSDNAAIMADVFDNTKNPAPAVSFPNTTLGNQLKAIARMIAGRDITKHKRQVFFASVGGYDLHGGQLPSHAKLFAELNDALCAFYDATVKMTLADKVTAFTASDFGRTFPSNGDGSDHGWGNHQLVVGGAVQANRIYGAFPKFELDTAAHSATIGRTTPARAAGFLPPASTNTAPRSPNGSACRIRNSTRFFRTCTISRIETWVSSPPCRDESAGEARRRRGRSIRRRSRYTLRDPRRAAARVGVR